MSTKSYIDIVLLWLIATVAIVSASSEISISWTNCTQTTDEAALKSITFNPQPPEKTDADWNATANIILKEAITDGSFNIKVTIFGITVDSETGDLCKAEKIVFPANAGSLTYQGIKCPTASSGTIPLDMTINVASSAPDSTVKVAFTSKDQNDKDLICIDFDLKVTG